MMISEFKEVYYNVCNQYKETLESFYPSENYEFIINNHGPSNIFYFQGKDSNFKQYIIKFQEDYKLNVLIDDHIKNEEGKIKYFHFFKGYFENLKLISLISSLFRVILIYVPFLLSTTVNLAVFLSLIISCKADDFCIKYPESFLCDVNHYSGLNAKIKLAQNPKLSSQLIRSIYHNLTCLKQHGVFEHELFKHTAIDYDPYWFDCHSENLISNVNDITAIEHNKLYTHEFISANIYKSSFIETDFKKCVCEGNLEICNFQCNLGGSEPIVAGVVYDYHYADVYYVKSINHRQDTGCVGGGDQPEAIREECKRHPICTYHYFNQNPELCGVKCGFKVGLLNFMGDKKHVDAWFVDAIHYPNLQVYGNNRQVKIAGATVKLPENTTVLISESGESCNNGFIKVNNLMFCRTADGKLPSPWFINYNQQSGAALAESIMSHFGLQKTTQCSNGFNEPYKEIGKLDDGLCQVQLTMQNTNNDPNLKLFCNTPQFKQCDRVRYFAINETHVWIDSGVCRFLGKLLNNGLNEKEIFNYYYNMDCTLSEYKGNGFNASCSNLILGQFANITNIDVDDFKPINWDVDFTDLFNIDISSKFKKVLPLLITGTIIIIMIIISLVVIIWFVNPVGLFKFFIQANLKRKVLESTKADDQLDQAEI